MCVHRCKTLYNQPEVINTAVYSLERSSVQHF